MDLSSKSASCLDLGEIFYRRLRTPYMAEAEGYDAAAVADSRVKSVSNDVVGEENVSRP